MTKKRRRKVETARKKKRRLPRNNLQNVIHGQLENSTVQNLKRATTKSARNSVPM
jgi:hypothetical protein